MSEAFISSDEIVTRVCTGLEHPLRLIVFLLPCAAVRNAAGKEGSENVVLLHCDEFDGEFCRLFEMIQRSFAVTALGMDLCGGEMRDFRVLRVVEIPAVVKIHREHSDLLFVQPQFFVVCEDVRTVVIFAFGKVGEVADGIGKFADVMSRSRRSFLIR